MYHVLMAGALLDRSRTWRTENGIAAARAWAAADLPASTLADLRRIQRGDGPASLLLSGLPIGGLPPTPGSHRVDLAADVRYSAESERTLLGIAAMLGEPVGYAQEHGGDIVQQIYPIEATRRQQVSTSSDSVLAFHTETSFHPHRPHFLLLLCLRGDAAARTTLCTLDAIRRALDPVTLDVLSQPKFRTGVDESFCSSGHTDWTTHAMPVIDGDTLVYDGELTVGIDAAGSAALQTLATVIEREQESVVLTAGDLLVVDNHRAVHGRSPFPARFDGTDRWLQRTFVVDDLAPSAAERTGRVITTSF
jgi:L-asparagine oxygenase